MIIRVIDHDTCHLASHHDLPQNRLERNLPTSTSFPYASGDHAGS